MNVQIESSWATHLAEEFSKPYFEELTSFVRQEHLNATVYPPPQNIFNAFELCPFDEVKVVILGQDPYHGQGQANGLSFAVGTNIPIPPSLQNILRK